MKTPKDLEGKTIAVNTLNNICGVTINATLEEKGVDVSTLKYTEVPFPEMVAALEKGRVARRLRRRAVRLARARPPA